MQRQTFIKGKHRKKKNAVVLFDLFIILNSSSYCFCLCFVS